MRRAFAVVLFLFFGPSLVVGCAKNTVLEKYRCRSFGDAEALDHTPPRLAGERAMGLVDAPAMQVRVQLPLRDREGLEAHIRDQHDPRSPRHRRFMDPREFAMAHGAGREDTQAVVDHLRRQGGLEVSKPQGNTVVAHGSSRQMERAFEARLHHFDDGTDAGVIAPVGGSPRLPVPVLAAHGLSTPPRRLSHAAEASGPGAPLTPATFRRAYNLADAAATGQTVGVLALDGYKEADLRAFAAQHSLPMPAIRNVWVNHYDGHIGSQSGQIETTMDIQILMASRPKEIVVFAAENTHTAFVDVLRRIANPPEGEALVHIVSCSWGTPEVSMSPAELAAQEELLMQMAAQGQTLVVAAGDSAAKDDTRHVGVDSPASSPHVLAVGGTTLSVHPDDSWRQETVWWRAGIAGAPDSGTGGGLSCVFDVPAWQRPTVSAAKGARSHLKRNLPDVSLCADPQGPGYRVIVEGRTMTVGGTSCAAPAMAGILAMVEAERAHVGREPLGFYTPAIYALAAQNPAMFHDIADGNTNGLYSALPGYDDATGFGSVDGAEFIRVLASH